MAVSESNPLIKIIHERYVDRPGSLLIGSPSFHKRPKRMDWHPVAAAVAKLGALLEQKGHRWNKGEKLLYRRAVLSVKHPCCPTCGKPMTENVITDLDGVNRKSWFCAVDQNF